MDDKNQNTNVVFPDGANASNQESLASPNTPRDLSYPRSLVSEPSDGSSQSEPEKNSGGSTVLTRLAKRADLILAILLILGSLGLVWGISRGPDVEDGDLSSQFDTPDIPLAELSVDGGITLGSQKVTINGALVITPSAQPANATAGQIYYDQTSNVLAYYDGVQFVPLSGGVSSIQGQIGPITLNGAGGITVTEDGAGNITLTGPGAGTAGVTSLNGLTGGLTVADASTAGTTITIDDASATNKGIASFNPTNLTVSSGVVNTIQNINTGATPTFVGVNTNTVQGGAGLSLQSGGNVTVGATDAAGTLLVVDTKTTAGDPAGADGAIYYNSASGHFRCFQGGVWTNCITASGGFVSLQNAYDNSTPAVVNLNATNDGILVRDTAGGIGGNLFAVQNSDGSTTYLGVTAGGANVGGDITVSNNATVQGGGLTVGSGGTLGQLVINDGGGSTGTLQTTTLSGNQTYTLPDATGTVCLDTGNCIGGPGGMIGGSGTLNRLAKFTPDGSNIGDSTITDDGVTVTTSVNMAIQGGNLTVGQAGATGALTLVNTNGNSTTLQAGASTGDLTFILPTGTGNQFQCLKKDTGDQLIWDDCEGGGGGVTTTLQQAYTAYGVNPAIITLNNDADGIIIRDAAPALGTTLLAVQNNTGTNSYFDLTASQLALGDATTNVNLILQGPSSYISNTQAESNSEAFGLGATVSDTAATALGSSATASNSSTVAIGTDATASGQFSIAVGDTATASGLAATALGRSAAAAGQQSTALGAFTSIGDGHTASIALGEGATTTAAHQLVIGGTQANDQHVTQVYIGSGVQDTAPQSVTINATGGQGTDIQGADMSIAGGRGTGTGAGGDVTFQIAQPAGVSGGTLNSLSTVGTFSGVDGSFTLQNAVDSTAALTVQTAGGADTLLTANTTNNRVVVGNGTGTDTATTLFVLDSAIEDPATNLVDGSMYYNSDTNQFRCRQGGNWMDCISASGGFVNLQNAYTNSTGGTTPEIVLDSTRDALDIQDQSDSNGGTIGENLLNIRASATDDNTLGTLLLGVGNTGAITSQNSVDSANAFRVLDQAGNELVGVNTDDSILRLLANNTGHLSGSGGQFITNSNSLPAVRSAMDAVTVNGYAYVPGGCDAGDGTTDTTYYARVNSNGSIDTWNSTATLPTPSCSSATTTYNGFIYVNGGTDSDTDDEAVYYARTNSDGTITNWITASSRLPAGQGREDHSMVAYNGYLYVIGGRIAGGTPTRNVHYAKINSDGSLGSFTPLTNWLIGNSLGSSATVANGYLYVTEPDGGAITYARFNADGSLPAAQDFASNADLSNFSELQVMNGYLYATPGVFSSNQTTISYAPLNSDGTVGAWVDDTTLLPDDNHAAGGFVLNNRIYIVGGYNGTANVNTVYYAGGTRVQVGGGLDLVGYSGESLSDGGSGGQLTAGNTHIAGTLNVTGNATFKDSISANGLAIMSGNNGASAFSVLNAAGSSLFTVNTSGDRIDINTSTFTLPNIPAATSDNILCRDTGTSTVTVGDTTNCSTSSARYKDNIQTMEDEMGLTMINALRPVTFTYKDGDGSTKVGLIAEEVHEVLPEVVAYDEQGRPNSINYEFMVANLIKAIQQQQVQIEELRQGVLSGALVEITGHIRVGKDTAGTVTIPAGQTSVNVTFNQPYETAPVVTLGAHDFVMVRVLSTTTTGFTLAIPEPAAHDIKINWTALEPGSAN